MCRTSWRRAISRFIPTSSWSAWRVRSLLPRLTICRYRIEEVAEIGWKVATALEDLHRQHVIHLDIKPSNILFRPTGEAVLIDFGLSRHTQLPDLMQEEFRLPYGTAPYMAPEQLLGVRHDPRSDQFALGVLLYFFSTGERPFGESERMSVMKKRLWRDPKPPTPCGPIIRHGCKRSCCAASKSSRHGAIPRRRNLLSSSATTARSS